jgi:hypothetical protein
MGNRIREERELTSLQTPNLLPLPFLLVAFSHNRRDGVTRFAGHPVS